ncbi:MAG: hypothetical protein V9G23_18520 [Giesbergeria sp.]
MDNLRTQRPKNMAPMTITGKVASITHGQFGATSTASTRNTANQDDDLPQELGQHEIKGVVEFFYVVGQPLKPARPPGFFQKKQWARRSIVWYKRLPYIGGASFAHAGKHHNPQVGNNSLNNQDPDQPNARSVASQN